MPVSHTRILVAESSVVYQSTLLGMLSSWGYDVILSRDGIEAWNHLQSGDGPHLAILERSLPEMDGVEICRRVRADGRLHYVYILLLTEKTEMADLVSAMEAGADDYITRPFHSQELRARLRAGCRIVQLQERLVRAREELYEQATRDSLTALWNRATILQILDNELARVGRGVGPIALLMVDLDRFKSINDTYGHMAGDAVLREAALRTTSILRQYDSVGRYGGEEFLVVVPGCDLTASLAVAERLRHVIAFEPFAIPEATLSVTCSIGVTWAASSMDANRLLRDADVALYSAKRNGRNRVNSVPVEEAMHCS